MIRELNYTDRIYLPVGLLSAKHTYETSSHKINLEWNFSSESLDSQCEIVCDVFVSNTSESLRFELGALGSGKNSSELDVSRMRNPKLARLRIKIIDTSTGLPLIRGVIDNFNPELPEDSDSSKSLLPIHEKQNLKTPWEVGFDRGVPTLYITDSGNLYQLLRNRVKAEWFFPLIMHKVLQEIFLWLGISEGFENSDKATKWKDLFMDYYKCPRDFFEKVSEMDKSERIEYVTEQSKFIAESVSLNNRDLHKLASIFDNSEGE